MKQISYNDLTIENAEYMIKTGYITELIFDGDNKTVNVPEKEYLEAEKILIFKNTMTEAIKPIVEALIEFGNKIFEVVQPIVEIVAEVSRQMSNCKLTRKKFKKMLQSQGIQRNEINKITNNNKEKYTYLRYYNIVNKDNRRN